MPIELDIKDGKYGKRFDSTKSYDQRDDKYRATKQYCEFDLFEKIRHTELNLTKDPSKRELTYLNFDSKKLKITFRSFHFSEDSQKLQYVDVYFSILDQGKPIVLGIVTRAEKYYIISDLTKLSQFTNILKSKSFGENELLDKLIKENNKQNNVITYRLDKSKTGDDYDGVEVESLEHPSFDKYKHSPKHGFNDRISYVLYTGRSLTIEQNREHENEKIISDFKDKKFCEIVVYYFKPQNGGSHANLPIFLELKEKNGQGGVSACSSIIYHLQRTDQTGLKWKQIKDPSLDRVITFLIDQKKDSGSYNDTIDVSKKDEVSIEKYRHAPTSKYQDKLGVILYNWNFIVLNPNDSIQDNKFDSFGNRKYSNITAYYPKPSSDQPPLFLELKVSDTDNGSTNDYQVQRIDDKGIYWSKIAKLELSDLITYFIGKRVGNETYNGIKVTSESNEGFFEKYSHKPISGFDNRNAILLYKGTSLVLEKSSVSTENNKLQSLENKTYSEVSVYFIQGSTNSSPVFIHITETTGSNNHWLQKANPNGLVWKQIDDPKLVSSIAYRLEVTNVGGSYNGINIKKEHDSDSKMDKYTHTANESENNALIFYNSNLLVLHPNDSIQENNRLKKLQKEKYNSILVYYSTSYNNAPPFFLELRKDKSDVSCLSSESSETTTNSKCYLLERLDSSGTHWRQTNKQSNHSTVDTLVPKIRNNEKSSIMVQLALKTSYDMKTIKNFETNSIESLTYPVMQVKVKENRLTPSYKYYTHDFSGSSTVSESKNISFLKFFFKSYEIVLHKPIDQIQKLEYNPTEDRSKIVNTYFYAGDDVHLMLSYDNKFYKPKSLDEYFKWEYVTDLETTSKSESIKNKLNEINKEFNQIKVEITSGGDYGKIKTKDRGTFSDIKARVKLTNQGESSQSYKTITHSTTNNSTIGKVTYRDKELMVLTNQLKTDNGTPISSQITEDKYNTVYVHYHSSDSSNEKPLLIGISKGDNQNPEQFFECVDNTTRSKWKKVTDSESRSLKQKGPYLVNKINKLHYDFNFSIKIQLDKQINTHNNYQLKLVNNSTADSSESSGTGNITVSENGIEPSLESNYKCLKHTIPALSSDPSLSEVGGLRLFLGKWELKTFDTDGSTTKSIFYKQAVNDVYVYFYKVSKVPLLFRYDDQCFKPLDRNQYFYKWISYTLTSGFDAQVSVLNGINKFLNNIELSETANTKAGKKYGILKPGKDPPNDIIGDFYDRISLKCCKNDHYRKITHSTIDGELIGDIQYQGKPLTGVDTNTQANEVAVYYDVTDKLFSRPLLFSLGSEQQVESQLVTTKKWYKRIDLQGTSWTKDEGSYGSKSYHGAFLKNKLQKIFYDLFTVLDVEIQQHYGYNKQVSIKNKEHTYELKVTSLNDCGGFEIRGYKCYQHQIYEYYTSIKNAVTDKPDLEFIIQVSIANRNVVLINKDKVSPLLTYTQENSAKNDSLFVYFSDSDEAEDNIPLVFNYKGTFFGPCSRDEYFKKWENLNIGLVLSRDYNPSDKIKENLERIFNMVNSIDLSQTSSYGISCCKAHPYYNHKVKKFNTKRVTVTKFTNTNKYTMYVHKTVKKTKIGSIKSGNDAYNFNQHSTQLSNQKIGEVVSIYKDSSNTAPILILLNESATFGYTSYTYGYYYQNPDRGDNTTEYNFHKLSSPYDVMSILKGESQEGILGLDHDDQLENLKRILENIGEKNMVNEPLSDLDYDTTNCKESVDIKEQLEKCPEVELVDISDDSTHAGSVESNTTHRLDDRIQIQPSASGAIDPGRRHDSTSHVSLQGQSSQEQVPAAPQAPAVESPPEQGSRGSEGSDQETTGVEGPKVTMGDTGTPGIQFNAGTDGQHGPGGKISGSPVTVDSGKENEKQQQETQVHEDTRGESSGHTTVTRKPEVDRGQVVEGGKGDHSSSSDSESSNRIPGTSDDAPAGPNGRSGANGVRHGDDSSSSGGETRNSGQTDSGGFIATITKIAKEQPEILYGSGSGVAGVGVVGTVGAVVYKKCVVGGAVAAGKAAANVAASAASGI